MQISISFACALAFFANALAQDNTATSSFQTVVTKTSTDTNTATETPGTTIQDCFYLASTSSTKSGYIYVGKTSGGFRSIVKDEKETQFGLSTDGKVFVKTLKAKPIGSTSDYYQGVPSPDVDWLYFTSFEDDTLVCSLKGSQLRCESTIDGRTRGYLVYSSEKRRFGYTSGNTTADTTVATWTVEACEEST